MPRLNGREDLDVTGNDDFYPDERQNLPTRRRRTTPPTTPPPGRPTRHIPPETIDYDRERAKEELQTAYREELGREMTDEDFDGWWSGEYGWGSAGIEGLDDWIRGIKHEGDRLKAEDDQPTPPPPPPTPPGRRTEPPLAEDPGRRAAPQPSFRAPGVQAPPGGGKRGGGIPAPGGTQPRLDYFSGGLDPTGGVPGPETFEGPDPRGGRRGRPGTGGIPGGRVLDPRGGVPGPETFEGPVEGPMPPETIEPRPIEAPGGRVLDPTGGAPGPETYEGPDRRTGFFQKRISPPPPTQAPPLDPTGRTDTMRDDGQNYPYGGPDPRGGDVPGNEYFYGGDGVDYEGERPDAPGGLAEPPSGPGPTVEPRPTPSTDQGPGPGPTGAGGPQRTGQAPPGYDQGKWDNPDHHTTKYDAAAFLYGLTKPSDIAAMVRSAEFQARFPGSTFNGKDKIDFGDNLEDGVPVGVIDVLMGADQGANTSGGLYWGAEDPDETEPPVQTGGGPGPTGGPRPTPVEGPMPPSRPPPWQQPPDSPLFNPDLTPGPPGLDYRSEYDFTGPGGGGGTMGNMITPYNPLATYSPVPYNTPDPFRPPAFEGATPLQQEAYQAATPFEQEAYAAADPFTGPTAEDMAADPGYQFRLRQGQEALERSGAARGVTNTGGTLRDILDYGQNAASQEYQNVFGRQRDVYNLNERNRFDAYQANYGNAMDAYNLNEANRYQGYTTNELARWQENQEAEARRSGAYGTNLGAYERQQQYGLRSQGQGFDQAYRNWQEQYNQGRQNAQDTYNRMYGLGTS